MLTHLDILVETTQPLTRRPFYVSVYLYVSVYPYVSTYYLLSLSIYMCLHTISRKYSEKSLSTYMCLHIIFYLCLSTCVYTLSRSIYMCLHTTSREYSEKYPETWNGCLVSTATHCNTLQHTATHCNTLQQRHGTGRETVQALIHIWGGFDLVDSLRLQVSFAKEPYKRDGILQKRPVILGSLLIVATPYREACRVWGL